MTEELAKLNFRDVGGLPARAGSLVRFGRLFRSEGPASFEPVHRSELAALGIRLVCDLRGEVEREKAPNDWAESARLLDLDINSDLRASPSELLDLMGADASAAALRAAILRNYAATPGALRPRMRELIQAIVDGETPALIHCTAGKDRTGVLVALLLSALGVPADVVVADYMRSQVFAQNLRMRDGFGEQMKSAFGFLPDDAFVDTLIGVDVEFLDAALDAMQREWGSIEGYFQAAAVEVELMDRFREALTVPVGSS